MYLELGNICGFRSAKVHIDGITVIAGNNNTGKSTIGKSLLLMFQSLHDLEQRIVADKIEGIRDALEMLFRAQRHSINNADFASLIYEELNKEVAPIENPEALGTFVQEHATTFVKEKEKDLFENIHENEFNDIAQQIVNIFHMDKDVYAKRFYASSTRSVFRGVICNNKHTDEYANINLIVKHQSIACRFDNNDVFEVKNFKDFYVKAIYIDNPFVLDELNFNIGVSAIRHFMQGALYRHVKYHLLDALLQEEETNVSIAELKEEGLQEVFKHLQSLAIGNLVFTKNGIKYKYNGDHELPIQNISTGLKVFLIIKTLLLNNSLQKNGTLILDEPEIHLHPEWQLVFAEILVLLQKTFGLHILLTTHSPYFLKAIETFAKKHEIQEKCHYYMTDCKDSYCTIEEVTENTQVIYKKFFDPFQALERIASHAD